MHRAACVLTFCLGLLCASCANTPTVETRISRLPGDPGSPADSAFAIDIEGRSVDRIPADWGAPLASRSTIITGPANQLQGASPSPAEAVLLAHAGELPQPGYRAGFGSVSRLSPATTLVPPGGTIVIAVTAPSLGSPPPIPPAVELIFRATPPPHRPDFQLRAARRATEEEALLLRTQPRIAQTLRIPWPLEGRHGTFLLAVPSAGAVDHPTLWQIRARPLTDDEASEVRAQAAPAPTPSPAAGRAAALSRPIRQARAPAEARRALAYACIDAGASLTSELIILADDKTLSSLATAAADALDQPAPDDPGFRIDRASLQVLAKLHADNLDRALSAALSARYGEVGRDVPTLAHLAQASVSRADLDRRLEAEHLILLEDSAPGLRVRAYDWLIARKAAPQGYDPVGPIPERRAAIARHLQSLDAQP